jgi:hypothetical protein
VNSTSSTKVPRKTKNQPVAAPAGEGEMTPPPANATRTAAAPVRSVKAKKTTATKTAAKKKSGTTAGGKKAATKRKSVVPRSAGAGVRRTSAAEVAPEAEPQSAAPSAASESALLSAAPQSAPSETEKPAPAEPSSELQTAPTEPSDEEIRIRAYFIAERRAQMSIHRDPALDWIEAREQLIAETQPA